MNISLESLFYDDFYGATWEINEGEIRQITWSIEDESIRLPGGTYVDVTASLDDYIDDIRTAFNIWSEAIESLNFVETSGGNSADVTIAATPIDGIGGTNGYWNYNWSGSNKYITEGTIRFDDSDLSSGWFLTTAMHEIGNILGLGDIRNSNEFMSVQEDPFPVQFDSNALWSFDQEIIDKLYPDTSNVVNSSANVYDGTNGDDILTSNSSIVTNDLLSGGDGDDQLKGYRGADELYGDAGDDILRAGNGRDIITGGSGFDDMYGGFGHNTFTDARDGYEDWLFFKSDQFAWNWIYKKAGNNANGQKVDVIKALDAVDRIHVQGVETSELTFSQVSNFSAPTGNFSGIGIFAKGFLEGIYTGGDLTAAQLQSMTVGVDA